MAEQPFEQRFWQKLYDPGQPGEIHQEYGDMLSVFRGVARQCPNLPAILYFDGSLSSSEVGKPSDRMAKAFIDNGLGAGDRVTGGDVRNAYGMAETSATVIVTPLQYEGPVDPKYGALSGSSTLTTTFAKPRQGGFCGGPSKGSEASIC